MIASDLINPHGNLSEEDRPFSVVAVPGWTEHYAFFAYDADCAYGAFIHIGRVPEDPTIWRGTIQIYLPGNELLVAKYFGRDGDESSAGAGPLRVRCVEPFRRFHVEFDGMAQRTTRQAITSGVLSDAPCELVKLTIDYEAAAPIHGRQAKLQQDRADGSFHTEQVGRISGEVVVKGKSVSLAGIGVRDHSNGLRSYGKIVSHLWFHGLFPSGLAFSIMLYRTVNNPEVRTANIFRGDGSPLEEVTVIESPQYPDLNSGPRSLNSDPVEDVNYRNCQFIIGTAAGPLTISCQPIHTHAITYLDPCEELNGTLRSRPDGLQMCDAPAIIHCNGERGVGLFERSGRIGILD